MVFELPTRIGSSENQKTVNPYSRFKLAGNNYLSYAREGFVQVTSQTHSRGSKARMWKSLLN